MHDRRRWNAVLPESANGTGGSSLAVPMAWLYAEYIADELLRTGQLIPPGTLEFRAGREALALTVYLSDSTDELSGVGVISQLDEWLSLTAYGHPWEQWVRERFAARGDAGGPDLVLARASWQWLESTELLATDLGGTGVEGDEDEDESPVAPEAMDRVDESAQVWLPAWQLGLPLGHLSVHLF
ncbi:hypothetical protein [Streptomyces sp. NPDC051561]|uniref:hypothetical protein n=1 Tax=Streptomyces sp. NPDC051561 TaxID=3365658 RepID=UPI0037BAF823